MTAEEYQTKHKRELLKVFGLEHTHDTKVGDQYVRGVSGQCDTLASLMLRWGKEASVYRGGSDQ